MKNKNLWWGLVLLALVCMAGAVIYFSGKHTAGTAAQQVFAYTDTAGIDQVIITDRGRATHTLARVPGTGKWLLDTHINVAPALVHQVLATLHDLKVKRPCARKERPEVVKQMATSNLKIEVIAKGEAVHTFFLGSSTDESQGNYALLADADEPVVVNLPNWQGFVSARFKVNVAEWENKLLFGSVPRDLQEVSVTFPHQPQESFVLHVQGGKGFRLATGEPLDTSRTITFLSSFSRIFVEEYFNKPALADSLAKATPLAKVQLKEADAAKSHTLWLYPRPFATVKELARQERIFGYIADSKRAITLQPQNVVPLWVYKSDLTR